MSTNHIVMKLTDIDLSNLAEVAAAVTLLEHVHRELATGGTPLPSLPPAQEIVVNPAMYLPPTQGSGETMMTPFARQQAAPISDDATRFDFPTLADAEKLRGMGVNPMTASESHAPMDAATVFGQSAAPLPPAPSTAGVAASLTAPAATPASGTGVAALPALAPLPAPSAAAPAEPVTQPSPVGGVELDTDGLPWDARIHAGTKRRNADGRWTAKKGINDPDLVPRVVAQLRAQMAAGGVTAPSATALPPAPPGSLGAALGVPQMTLGQLQEAQMLANVTPPVVAQSAPAPSTPPVLHAAPTPTTYLDFMTAATVEVQSGRVPIEAFGEVCKSLGGATALSTNPELIPIAWATLKAKYPGML